MVRTNIEPCYLCGGTNIYVSDVLMMIDGKCVTHQGLMRSCIDCDESHPTIDVPYTNENWKAYAVKLERWKAERRKLKLETEKP